MSIKLRAAVLSGCGCVRKNNEDAFYFNGRFAELTDMNKEHQYTDDMDINTALFAVCDGIGGRNHGEIASFTTVKRLSECQISLKTQGFEQTMLDWTEKISVQVDILSEGGGCTMALVYFDDDCVRIAHIGDSRVYRWHKGLLTQLTKDHSKIQLLMDAGILTSVQAKKHPDRHMINRYIGMKQDEDRTCMLEFGLPMPICKGDRYLICSDGVTDMLDHMQIADLVEKSKNAEDCAQTIYHQALMAGGRDNTTILTVEIENDGLSNKPVSRNAQTYCDSRYEQTDAPIR